MFRIRCPYCGERDQIEFGYGGEAHIARPADPDALSDAQWADYVFMRTNTKGLFAERWVHSAGCRRWFNALRDTATDRFVATYVIGEAPPLPVPQLVPGDQAPDPAEAIPEEAAGGGQR
ncbi:MAG: sarcosine oxidase subunit delta [Salinarimonas sp.]|nr:sarcosine oxidase subunit delta [Salinarimonas sp.]